MIKALSFLEILRLREAGLVTLYQNFAESFQGFGDFWLGMSSDEYIHAKLVEKLRKQIEEQNLVCALPMEELFTFYEVYQQLIQLIHASNPQYELFTCQEAIWVTGFVEDITIAQLSVEILDSAHQKVDRVINRLLVETREHFRDVRTFIADNQLEDPAIEGWDLGRMIDHIAQKAIAKDLDLKLVFSGQVEEVKKTSTENEFEEYLQFNG